MAGTISLLDAMVATGTRCLVLSSTCATYGLPEVLPIAEDHPQRPVNPYGESKLSVERALKWYEDAHGLRSVALRFFNAAGADPDGEIGEDHDPETHLVPLAIQAALGLRKELNVFGTDYPTPDGTAIRDYIHVADLAAARAAALHYLTAENRGVALNLGTGHGHSVREVIRQVMVAGRRADAMRCRGLATAVLVATSERAAQLLAWRAQHSDLATIVQSAWRWHRGQSAAPAPKIAVG
jgi:UDP-glucose-4-epimerase GalE